MTRPVMERPNLDELLAPLKGFQRATVQRVFQRMYLDPEPTTRFLVADEVGLGKTLVARGVIAHVVNHLWDERKHLNVLYICSNQAIAAQNLSKLAIAEGQRTTATRLTLLPRDIHQLRENKLNFISLTPGTALDLRSQGGRWEERLVLYRLLREIVNDSAALQNMLQGDKGKDAWRDACNTDKTELDESLAKLFKKAYRAPESAPIRKDVRDGLELFARHRDKWSDEQRVKHARVVGALRTLLARTCADALEPDLVILDEFQRSAQILHDESDESELARAIWSTTRPSGRQPRVLLLSATPYRMYSTDDEQGADDSHYKDFIATTAFLMGHEKERVARFQRGLSEYRSALYKALQGDEAGIAAARRDVEQTLRDIMVRTERVRATADRMAMAAEKKLPAPLEGSDIQQWLLVDELTEALKTRDAIGMWKSAPYLPQFMRSYDLKRKLQREVTDDAVVEVFRKHRGALIKKGHVGSYRRIEFANARLRALSDEFLGRDQWKLLWMPPTLSYWPLAGCYSGNADFTKALVFSSWNVVPDVVSALLSYEAERRMVEHEEGVRYETLYKSHRGLLRFAVSDGRVTGMNALALQYPCVTLADEVSPLALWQQDPASVVDGVRRRVRTLIERLPNPSGRHDERWYWSAPVMLDALHGDPLAFLESWALVHPSSKDAEHFDRDGDGEESDASRFADHVHELIKAAQGELALGSRPADLEDVLTEMALGAPAVLAMRSLRATGCSLLARQKGATLVAEGFRSLFNQPAAIAVVRRAHPDVAHWQATLRYAIDGGLQAVLDEHFHQTWLRSEWDASTEDETAHKVANEMGFAASIKVSRVGLDALRPSADGLSEDTIRIRTSFALRYGRIEGDQDSAMAREGAVRAAFNSPYRPFVLASTSIGQEGLDFHHWCHAVVHWNLPGNPVDLEQREGRVHRYEGHAVRKNVAERYAQAALRERWQPGEDVWKVIFDYAADQRPEDTTDLMPWWVCDGPHRVLRYVPELPYSREVQQWERLKRDLVRYRLAFGQPRQQELVGLVASAEVDVEKADTWLLDLRPEAQT